VVANANHLTSALQSCLTNVANESVSTAWRILGGSKMTKMAAAAEAFDDRSPSLEVRVVGNRRAFAGLVDGRRR
jgi:hypothetical protein